MLYNFTYIIADLPNYSSSIELRSNLHTIGKIAEVSTTSIYAFIFAFTKTMEDAIQSRLNHASDRKKKGGKNEDQRKLLIEILISSLV